MLEVLTSTFGGQGNAAVHFAAQARDIEGLTVLLRYVHTHRPMHGSTVFASSAYLLAPLLSKNAKTDAVNAAGQTPADLADTATATVRECPLPPQPVAHPVPLVASGWRQRGERNTRAVATSSESKTVIRSEYKCLCKYGIYSGISPLVLSLS